MFRVDIVAPNVNGEETILTGVELKQIFDDIIKQTSDRTKTAWNPSVLTTQGRSVWAKVG